MTNCANFDLRNFVRFRIIFFSLAQVTLILTHFAFEKCQKAEYFQWVSGVSCDAFFDAKTSTEAKAWILALMGCAYRFIAVLMSACPMIVCSVLTSVRG